MINDVTYLIDSGEKNSSSKYKNDTDLTIKTNSEGFYTCLTSNSW